MPSGLERGHRSRLPRGLRGNGRGRASGLRCRYARGLPCRLCRGLTRGLCRGLSRGLSRGHSRGLPRGLPRGHSRGPPRGHSRGLPSGHSRGLPRGHSRGLPRGHFRRIRFHDGHIGGECKHDEKTDRVPHAGGEPNAGFSTEKMDIKYSGVATPGARGRGRAQSHRLLLRRYPTPGTEAADAEEDDEL